MDSRYPANLQLPIQQAAFISSDINPSDAEAVSGGDVSSSDATVTPQETTGTEAVSGNDYVQQLTEAVLGTETSEEQLYYYQEVLTSLERQEVQNEAILATLLILCISGAAWILYRFLRWFF